MPRLPAVPALLVFCLASFGASLFTDRGVLPSVEEEMSR